MASDATPITTVAELLRVCKLEHIQLTGSTLSKLDALLTEGRPKLLEHLKESGVSKLPERQGLCNRIAKAKREGLLTPAANEVTAVASPAANEVPAVASPAAGTVDVSDADAAAAPPAPSLPPPPPRDSSRPLRVLCLHSFRANGKILKQQMMLTGQEKFFEGLVEFDFLDAPYECTAEDEAKQYDVMKKYFPTTNYGAYREWFNAFDVPKGGTGPPYVTYARCESAIAAVESALKGASPPFDGLMGFSQGGSLAMWIATLQARGKLRPEVPTLRFLWVQSARLPRDHSCKGLYDTPLSLPTFITYVEDDDDVKPHETRALITKIDPPPLIVTRGKGGHGVMPMRAVSAEDQAKIKEFLQAHR